MKTDYRNRIVLPVVLPLLVLLGLAVLVGSIALIFLFTTRLLALTIAVVAATGIMVAVSLANSIDEEDMTIARRAVIVLTGVLPLVLGAGVALWSANGGVDESLLNINKEPLLAAPEGALVAAKNDQSFCLFGESGEETEANCTDVDEVTMPAQPDGPFLMRFVNLQANIQHNFQLFELAGSEAAPEPGESIYGVSEGAAIIVGPDETIYSVPQDTLVAGGQYYYNCIVHPVMNGVLTIAEGEDGAEGDATAEA